MGAIAAVFSKSETDATQLVGKMLCAMRHRGQDGVAVASHEDFESAPAADRLSISLPARHSAIGYGFTRILPTDLLQPIQAGEGWLCLDGRIVADRRLVGGEEAVRLLQDKVTPVEFSRIQSETDGAYSICYCTDDGLFVTRDPMGLKSLFIGRQGNLVAIASDRKALWAVGIREVTTFPPGGCLKASPQKTTIERPEVQPETTHLRPQTKVDAEELLRSLVESASIQTAGLDKIALGFSGGLDSTLLAKIAKDIGKEPLLVTVGIGRTSEMIQAESTAKEIGLPIAAKSFSMDDVMGLLDRVLWLIEEPILMKVSIALAVHLTAEVALENARSVLILGQGSDELFGGYKRFATILGERGADAAVKAISESVRSAYEVNYQRDDQAVSSLRAELRFPFATRKLVEFASRVPLSMKVRSSSDNLRKWILREAAVKLGLSSALAMRPKKAIQHASGIEKVIREIAKKRGQSASAYLEHRLEMAKDNLEAF